MCLILGIVVTVAEPDLQVLAEQLPTVPNLTLILAVALGVGVFLVLSQVRMLLHIPLSHTLVFFYVIVFILAYFAPNDFIPAAFDSGGVTTGPITVPFIMALGIGMAAIRSDKDSGSDSFGLVAMCSIGPVLSVLLLGIFMPDMDAAYTPVSIPVLDTTRDAALVFAKELPDYIGEVALALLPVVAIFGLFQLLFRRFHRRQLGQDSGGTALYLCGTGAVSGGGQRWLYARRCHHRRFHCIQPAKMATGAHWSTGWLLHRSGGTGGAGIGPPGGGNLRRFHYPALDSLRAVHRHCSVCGAGNGTDFNGHQPHVVPDSGYAISLSMTFFVPQIFTGVAFDSGGVASGPMTTTFLLPFAMGACEALGGNVLTDAFGIVALVAMTPLCTIQLLGIADRIREKIAESALEHALREELETLEDGVIYWEVD